MQSIFSYVLMVHVAAGLAIVVLGLVPILTRKGGPTHRAFGKLFAVLMGVLLVAAWVMTVLHFKPYLAALTVLATMSLVSGVRVLGRKRPDLDPRQRARLFDWLVVMGAMGVGGWILYLLRTGAITEARPIAYVLVWSAAAYGGWDLWRFLRPTAFPFFPELWFYEHLTKMLGAYSAALSAFAGNFLPFLPSPWRELWPTMLFQALTLLFILHYAVRGRRPRREAPMAA
jgi:uncharacterized membrane protein